MEKVFGDWGSDNNIWNIDPTSPVFMSCCCSCLSENAKQFARSIDKKLELPCFLAACFFFPCTHLFARIKMRTKGSLGGNVVGDLVCCLCCGPCSLHQTTKYVYKKKGNSKIALSMDM